MNAQEQSQILSNQVLIMRALKVLLADGPGHGFMRGELDRRIADIEQWLGVKRP